MKAKKALTTLAIAGILITPEVARGEKRPIDVARSTMKVHVYRTGLFAAFAHDHEIEAPIARGEVESAAPASVWLEVDARKLRVLDPQLSEKKRAEVQSTMDGPKVLDSSRVPKIRFQSTELVQAGAGHWTLHRMLTLYGQTRPVAVDVTEKDGRYRGSATLKQRDFGITPVTIAGGTVRVKDEVRVEFEIVLAQ